MNAAEAQDAGAVRRLPVVLRGYSLLVGAAVRTADAIERVQGREQDEHRGGDEPSHALIMRRFWTAVPGLLTIFARSRVSIGTVSRFAIRTRLDSIG